MDIFRRVHAWTKCGYLPKSVDGSLKDEYGRDGIF